MAWNALNGDEGEKAIAQARAFFPEGPKLFY
jgi:hypothetical protein